MSFDYGRFGASAHRLPCTERYPLAGPNVATSAHNSNKWQSFLRDLGVKHVVDEPLFLDCCQTLEDGR
jgi:hypothetical protein